MAAGLVLAEILAVLFSTDASPIVEVGNRVVDAVPKPARDWAISTFGTSDKAVLLVGVVITLLVIASLVGSMALRGARSASVAVIAVVVVLGASSSLGRGGSGPGASVSTLAGGALTVTVLLWLTSLADAAWPRSAGARGGSTPACSHERRGSAERAR